MNNWIRNLVAGALWLATLIGFAAFGSWYGLPMGGVLWYTSLWLTSRPENEQFWKGLHWKRLQEPRIQFFLGILGLAHVIPGAIIAETLSAYLWIFLLAAVIHLALETFVILNRPPKDPNAKPKPAKISRGYRSKRIREPPVWLR